MPEMTITISDDDLAQLGRLSSGQDATRRRRYVERIVHRSLNVDRTKPLVSNVQRSALRARRQLEIAQLLRRRRPPTLSMKERAELARKYGTSVRTITRDLEVALLTVEPTTLEPVRARRKLPRGAVAV
jgi:hypothetical protein